MVSAMFGADNVTFSCVSAPPTMSDDDGEADEDAISYQGCQIPIKLASMSKVETEDGKSQMVWDWPEVVTMKFGLDDKQASQLGDLSDPNSLPIARWLYRNKEVSATSSRTLPAISERALMLIAGRSGRYPRHAVGFVLGQACQRGSP